MEKCAGPPLDGFRDTDTGGGDSLRNELGRFRSHTVTQDTDCTDRIEKGECSVS